MISFALVAGTYCLFFLFFEPGYETNDDFGMMSLASGLLRSDASPFMVFTHVSIGYVLKTLYTWMPSVPWYAFYLYSFQILAWTLIAHALLTLHRGREAVAFFVASFLLIGFRTAMKLQFTSTSILLGAAAAFYFLVMSLRSRSWMLPVFTGGLIGTVGLIRESSIKVTLAIWAPLFVYAAFKNPVKRTFLFCAAIASVVIAAAAISSVAYDSDPRWSEYAEFNTIRGQLHGNANFDPSMQDLRDVGWYEADLLLFSYWLFADPEVYSTENLKSLLGKIKNQRAWDNFSHELVSAGFRYSESQLIGALLITLVLLAWATPKGMGLALANWAWVTLVAAAAILMYGRMPVHVLIPMALSATLGVAFIAGIPRVSLRPASIRGGARLLFTTLILLVGAVQVQAALKDWVQESREHVRRDAALRSLYDDLHAFDPQGIFVNWGTGVRMEHLSLLATGSDLPSLRFISLGWSTRSPMWLDEVAALEIDDLYTALAQKEHLYFLKGGRRQAAIKSLQFFLKIRRGISADFFGSCIDSNCSSTLFGSRDFSPPVEMQPHSRRTKPHLRR